MEKIVELCLGIFEDKDLCDKLSSISRVNTNLSEIERRYTTLNQQLGSALKELASQRETVASAESLSLQAQQKYQARIDQLENLVRELGDQISKTDQQAASYLQQIRGQVQSENPFSNIEPQLKFIVKKNQKISQDLLAAIRSRNDLDYPAKNNIEYAALFADPNSKETEAQAFYSGVQNLSLMVKAVIGNMAYAGLFSPRKGDGKEIIDTADGSRITVSDSTKRLIDYMSINERRIFGKILEAVDAGLIQLLEPEIEELELT